MDLRYITSCVSASAEDIEEMVDNAVAVDIAEMRQKCNHSFDDLIAELGYSQDFPIERDRHVCFCRSNFQGNLCYYLEHSRIEYIFA